MNHRLLISGKLVLRRADYLYTDTPRDNVVAMIEAARDEGRY